MSYDWELIDFCPDTGLKKYIGNNPDDEDGVSVRYEQDAQSIEEILERNKRSQNEGFDKSKDVWHAAHIPIGIMYEWITKHGVNAWDPAHRDGVVKLLDSDEYRWLRVNEFIIGRA